MKIRIFATAAVLVSLIAGSAAVKAENTTTDRDRLNGYARMTYSNIAMSGGQEAAVAVKGDGSSLLRLSVFDYHNNLIAHTSCRVDTCLVTWIANRDASFYVTVENLGGYSTEYGFALSR
jgi:hypothetical protein